MDGASYGGMHVRYAAFNAVRRWWVNKSQARGEAGPSKHAEAPSRSLNMDDIDDDDCPAVASSARDSHGLEAVAPEPEGVPCAGAEQSGGGSIADRIWVATGTYTDILADPLLSDLRSRSPGAYTALSIGPMARLMPGYRFAAERVVPSMKSDALSAFKGEAPYALPAGALPIDLYDDEEEILDPDGVDDKQDEILEQQ
eukprot:gene20777-24906_t